MLLKINYNVIVIQKHYVQILPKEYKRCYRLAITDGMFT